MFCEMEIIIKKDGIIIGSGKSELSNTDIYRIVNDELKGVITIKDINGNSNLSGNFTIPDI